MQIPVGFIVLWANSIASIPAGWALCDGNNGTPNLLNKFVRGAGGALAVDETGGNAVHSHDFEGDGHDHDLSVGSGVGAGTDFATTSTSEPAGGIADNASTIPPFHALAYIMKL